jgi:transcriptional regulator with XRE-family HTH domain
MAQDPPGDPSVLRRELGIELRRHREAAKLTQSEVAGALEFSLSKVVRIEQGAHGVSASDLRAMLMLYNVTEKTQVDKLAAAARGSRGKSWWSAYSDVVTPQLARLLGYEAMASAIWVIHPFLIPGLLHTQDYASGLYAAFPGATTSSKLVELRMSRQTRVFAQSGTSLNFVVGEEALYRWVGGPEVMRGQLERLLDVGRRDNVSIRIVPFTAGAHPGLTSPFIMLRLRETDDELLFLESVNGDQLINDDPAQIAEYAEYLEMLRELSVEGEEAEALLRNQIERLQRAAAGRGR